MEIRIIGCGAMGSAIAKVLAENGKKISLYDIYRERAETLARSIKARVSHSPLEGLVPQDYLLLAIKPQNFQIAANQLQAFKGRLVASIITGITLSQLKTVFSHSKSLRMMPNLAVRYGAGITALAEVADLTPLKTEIEMFFSPLGVLRWLPEENFDAITALTGSGPAFVFTLIEAMVDATVAMGLSSDMGYDLVKHMIEGTLTILYESNKLPGELKWHITSPAGTTIAGLRTLENKGIRSGIIETFLTAFQRARELKNSKS